MPVVVEILVDEDVYTLFPKNVVLVDKSPNVAVDGRSSAALSAFTKSMYALFELVLPGAITLPPTTVPGEGKPEIVPDPLPTPTLP